MAVKASQLFPLGKLSSWNSFLESKGAIRPKGFNTAYIQIFCPTWHFVHASERTCDTSEGFSALFIFVWVFFLNHYEFFHDFKANRDKRKSILILYIHRAFAQHELTYFSERKYDETFTTLVTSINFAQQEFLLWRTLWPLKAMPHSLHIKGLSLSWVLACVLYDGDSLLHCLHSKGLL